MRLAGTDASFWSAKTGQMHVRRGRAWITVSVGPPKIADREMEPARQFAETLLRKL